MYLFLQHNVNYYDFEQTLNYLVRTSSIYLNGEFYSLHNNYLLVRRRYTANEKAKILIQAAEKASSILSYLPFVRGIAVSGSLSKNCGNDNGDVSLFVITSKNRLWIARALMNGAIKIIQFLNRDYVLHLNYFVDETSLEIVEKNIYTATEIVTLIPLKGCNAFEAFYKANRWTKTFLPNNFMRVSTARDLPVRGIKLVLEKGLNNVIGDFINRWLMKQTRSNWSKVEKMESGTNPAARIMTMISSIHLVKPDPLKFQDPFLDLYERKLNDVIQHTLPFLKPAP